MEDALILFVVKWSVVILCFALFKKYKTATRLMGLFIVSFTIVFVTLILTGGI